MYFKYLLLFLLLSACSVRVHDGNTVLYDEGGYVDRYEEDAKVPHRIKGTAISAATIYLRTGCVFPESTLVFHPPGGVKEQYKLYWAERIASNYPERIRVWYLSNWKQTRTKSGQWAIDMGTKKCT